MDSPKFKSCTGLKRCRGCHQLQDSNPRQLNFSKMMWFDSNTTGNSCTVNLTHDVEIERQAVNNFTRYKALFTGTLVFSK